MEQTGPLSSSKIMDTSAIQRFVMHFERLTRWNLEELPSLADMTLELDRSHRFVIGSRNLRNQTLKHLS
jgi:D-glycerate 3-kinase